MLDRRKDGAHPPGETFPSVVSLHRTSDGALEFVDDAGWRLTMDGAASWVLEEHRLGAGGFVLRSRELPDAREFGQTTRSEPTESRAKRRRTRYSRFVRISAVPAMP